MTDFIAKVAPMLLDGTWMTLKITFISVVLAALLALPMSILRIQSSRVYRWRCCYLSLSFVVHH